MKKYSMLTLILLGTAIIATGSAALLADAGIVAISLKGFGALLVLLVGLWVIACAVECHRPSNSQMD